MKTHIASAYHEAAQKGRNLSLSAREIDVLLKIIQGRSNKDIAVSLGISTHTVNGYVRRILLKTGVKDRLSACLLGLSIPVIGNKILSEAILANVHLQN
jgi:DNA-binding CsgD family transcriptional regulator